jgi:hypothetical protein
MPNTGGTGTVDSGARGRNGITIPCSGNPPLWARTWAKYPNATVIAITHTRMRIKVTVPEAGFIGDLLKVFRLLLGRLFLGNAPQQFHRARAHGQLSLFAARVISLDKNLVQVND